MARRSPYLGDYNLPVGGRSSGTRPKKTVRAKIKKSAARRDAEQDLKIAKAKRKRGQERAGKNIYGKTSLAKPVKKQVKALKQIARKAESLARKPDSGLSRGSKEMLRDAAKTHRKIAAEKPGKIKSERKWSAFGKKSSSSPYHQATAKEVVKAKKRVAKTPKHSGKYRTGSGRNQFLVNPRHSQH